MGLFDQLASQAVQAVAGQMLQGNGEGGGLGNLAQAAFGLIQNQEGGLAGLVQNFAKSGLGDVAASWVGSGANLPINAEQIASVLGSSQIGELASKFGIDANQISSGLATVLPMVIDQLTPHGEVNDHSSSLLQQGATALLGSLFNKG